MPDIIHRAAIARPFAELRRSFETESAMETEALFGQRFDVLEQRDGRTYGRLLSLVSDRVDYTGWLDASCLGDRDEASVPVTALRAPVFSKTDIKSPILMTLPRNSRVSTLSQTGDFHQIQRGYIHTNHLTPPEGGVDGFMQAAWDQMGQPYIWGGTGGQGLDCSGLVQSALAHIGIDVPRDAGQQESALARDVALDDAQAGDLIFWPGHVGIIDVDRTLLHANAFHMMTAIEDLDVAIARIGAPRSLKRLSFDEAQKSRPIGRPF